MAINDTDKPATNMWEGYEQAVRARNARRELSEEMSTGNITTGYPHGEPKYRSPINPGDNIDIEPSDHFNYGSDYTINPDADTPDTYLRRIPEHFIRDINTPQFASEPLTADAADADMKRQTVTRGLDGEQNTPSFSGSTTHVNPLNDGNVADIATHGLWNHEKTLNEGKEPRVSPLLPFTRVNDPSLAQAVQCYYYNRTKIPIADSEWRKGFRHVFITRPECYIMSTKGSQLVLSEQCEYDREFASLYHQCPHVLKMLSPYYITGDKDNFNYLLSNRAMGLSVNGTTLSHDETIQKSIEGYTVQPARLMTSNQGSTIDITFRDTKNLDVFNCLRAWMLYNYKTYKGILAPSYNGYKYTNSYNLNNGKVQNISDNKTWQYMMHPYDRALDYCATIFDIVTNESGTKILYWCKYFGVYPISINPSGLSNQNNGPLTQEMTLSAQFKYQRKMEMNENTFVEFNFNAGLVTPTGELVDDARTRESLSFAYHEDNDHNGNVSIPSLTYMGASGMFVGTPYIVLYTDLSPIDKSSNKLSAYLKFMPMDHDLNGRDFHEMNNRIEQNEYVNEIVANYGEDLYTQMGQQPRDYYEGYAQARRAQREARENAGQRNTRNGY